MVTTTAMVTAVHAHPQVFVLHFSLDGFLFASF